MNITNNINFTSRNSEIRFADNLVRKINQEFPRVSVTKIECFKNSKEFDFLIENLWDLTSLMRSVLGRKFIKTENPVEKIKLILDTIKNKKLGNCKESAQLSLIVAKMNGIKNCKVAYLLSPENYDYDHAIVFVEGKNPYIIDAWLGFADYVPNAIKKYQKDFRDYFDFEGSKTEKMKVVEDFGLIQHFLNNIMSNHDINKAQTNYKELLLRNV